MRELFAFIRAAIEAAPYYLQAKLDQWTDADPFDTGGHTGDDATLDEVEAFLDRVARVADVIEVHPSMMERYLTGPLGIELEPWQRNLLAAYYGGQA